ncbi:MAG: hypothetical protein ACXVDD_21990, partial [Polyangia bacterium]
MSSRLAPATVLLSLFAAPLAFADAPKSAATEWEIEGQWMDTCSCTLPCPCWKSEKPTFGKGCE